MTISSNFILLKSMRTNYFKEKNEILSTFIDAHWKFRGTINKFNGFVLTTRYEKLFLAHNNGNIKGIKVQLIFPFHCFKE